MTNTDIKQMTFEAAMNELEEIVRELENGNQDLDGSIGKYERGTALKTHCEAKLKEASLKVEKITGQNDDGEVTTETTTIETSANATPAPADSNDDLPF